MRNIFWNDDEQRLRTIWRILLMLMIYLIIIILLSNVVKIFTISLNYSDSSLYSLSFILLYSLIHLSSVLSTIYLSCRFIDKRPFSNLGFHIKKSWWIDFVFGMWLGVFLILIIFLVELSFGWIQVTGELHLGENVKSFFLAIVVLVLFFIQIAVTEEIMTRGYLLKNISEGLSSKKINFKNAVLISYFITSIIFGIYHINNPNTDVISTINLIFGGIFLGSGYVLTGELAIPIGLHLTWNLFQGNFFGFPVSGMIFPAEIVTFIEITQMGPDILTGGSFGPEAGLLGLLSMIIGIIFIMLWVRRHHRSAKIYTNLAIPVLSSIKK